MASNNKTIYAGRSQLAYVSTDENGELKIIGAPFEVDEVVKKVQRQGFEITYLTYVFELFDRLGGKKYAVLKYIMSHKDSENKLVITTRELAQKCGVSRNTVLETLAILREAKLVTTRTGAIMLNPRLAHRGSNNKEIYLLQKFEAFGDEG